MVRAASKYGIELPDRQLCCAPIRSAEGERYLGAMAAAANFAFANRQTMTHWVRESFAEVHGDRRARARHLDVVYDVCHNTAKFETFTASAVASVSTARAPRARTRPAIRRSRSLPRRRPAGAHPRRHGSLLVRPRRHPARVRRNLRLDLPRRRPALEPRRGQAESKRPPHPRRAAERGVVVRAAGYGTVVEEMPEAYKDVADVVRVVHEAGIARRVAQLRPIGVIKG